MSKSTLVTIISVLTFLAAGAGLYLLNMSEDSTETNVFSTTNTETSPETTSDVEPEVADSKLIIGDPEAQVSIVEYVDYKCPNCNRFSRTTEVELKNTYSSDQVNIEIRQTPIIGPDSANAARGAYCANEQNVFPVYHQNVLDFMWNNYYESGNFASEFEDILTTEKLIEMLPADDVDSEEFRVCVDSNKYNTALDRDLLAAADDSVRGTPGFVVGGQSFVGLQPLSVFTALINNQL